MHCKHSYKISSSFIKFSNVFLPSYTSSTWFENQFKEKNELQLSGEEFIVIKRFIKQPFNILSQQHNIIRSKICISTPNHFQLIIPSMRLSCTLPTNISFVFNYEYLYFRTLTQGHTSMPSIISTHRTSGDIFQVFHLRVLYPSSFRDCCPLLFFIRPPIMAP